MQAEDVYTRDPYCPFCAIAAGEDRSPLVVWEDAEWLAFFPRKPATRGHTLVVPRRHVPDFWALEPNLAGTLAGACVRVGQALQSALSPEGMNLITSRGATAEQTVFHVHLHVLPRWHDDAVDAIWPDDTTAEDLAATRRVADEVRLRLGAP